MHLHWILIPLVTWTVVICLETTETSPTEGSGDADEQSTTTATATTTPTDYGQQETKDTSSATVLERIEAKLAEEHKMLLEEQNRNKELDKKIDSLAALIQSQKVSKEEVSEKRDVQPTVQQQTGETRETEELSASANENEPEYSSEDADKLVQDQSLGQKANPVVRADDINALSDRIAAYEAHTQANKDQCNAEADRQIQAIKDSPNINEDKQALMIKDIEEKRTKMNDGYDNSLKEYKKMEVNIVLEGSGYKATKKQRALDGLRTMRNKLGAGLTKHGDKFAAVAGEIGNIITLFHPDTSWQKRAEAAAAILAVFASFLPPPAGLIGPAILGIIGACFGAAAPTTDEYKVLRNEILNGVADMFDAQQKAEAMGCVYKLEFLKEVLDVQDSHRFTDAEFNALVIAGGIDVGVATLGTLKFKMEYFRDKNEILTGRQALEMAHMYVLVAEQRDLLTDQITKYLNYSVDPEKDGGFTTNFFDKTRDMSKKNYKEMFWWDDLCCEKDPKHFSALLAYSMPIKKHTGKKKAAGVLHKFLKKYRTQDYYNDDLMEVSKKDTLHVDTPPTSNEKAKVGHVKLPKNDRYEVFGSLMYEYYFLGVTTTAASGGIQCDTGSGDEAKIYEMGILSRKFKKEAKLKFEFLSKEEEPEPRGATVTVQWPGSRISFITTQAMLVKNKDKLLDAANTADHRTLMTKIDTEMKNYDKHDLFAMCSNGKKFVQGGHQAYNYKENMNTEASIRVFPVKLPTWGEPRYLIGPAGQYIGDDLVLLSWDMPKKDYKKIPDTYLNDAVGARSRPEINGAKLDADEFRKFFFIIRGDLVDNNLNQRSDQDIYPAGWRGGVADMKCHWGPNNVIPNGPSSEYWQKKGINNNGDTFRGCASACLDWKVRRPLGDDDWSDYYGAAVTESAASSKCFCYYNVTGFTSSNGYRTCFFRTTKGCGYDIMIANGQGYDGQYHIDGTSNDRTTWAKASDDTKAVWWDKKNKVWCAGPRVSRGKECTNEMYTGKKAPTSGASADNSATVNINCPHDNQLRWYKGEQQAGTFRISNVS